MPKKRLSTSNSRNSTRFVLIGVPRVGSNYLISLLNLHPEVLCHYEVFSKDAVYLAFKRKMYETNGKLLQFKDIELRDKDPLLFLERLYRETDKPVIGFNIFPNQNDDVLENVITNPEIKNVIIERENFLKSYVSLQIARRNNAWNSLISSKLTIDDKRFQIDIKHFEKYRYSTSSFYKDIKRKFVLTTKIIIALNMNNFSKNKKVLGECFDFLGTRYHPNLESETSFKKENKEGISDIIVNFDVFSKYCEDNGFTQLLD